jgi:drug/metabolite transporter (DMT)-like permease
VGALIYCIALFLAVVDQSMVHLAGSVLSVPQFAFIRNCGGLLVVIAMAAAGRHGCAVVRTKAIWLQLTRGSVLAIAQLVFMAAFVAMPMSLATAVLYLQPLFMTMFGFLLGERLRLRHLLSIAAGLIGAVMIVKPTIAAWNWMYLIALSGPLLNAGAVALGKQLEKRDPIPTTMFFVSVVGLLFTGPLSIGEQIPSLPWWLWVSLLLAGPIANYLALLALRYADVAALAPYPFIRLPIAAAIGFAIFHEVPDAYSFVGAGIILIACSVPWPRSASGEGRLRQSGLQGPG